MRTSGLARWAPLSGAFFVVLWVAAFVAVGDTVESGDSDAEIQAFYADDRHRTGGSIALFLLLLASLLFIVFISVLRGGLARAERGAGGWTTAAFGAGLVATTLWAVAATLFFLPALTLDDASEFQLDPDTFRLLSNAGYVIWFSGATMMSIAVLATSVLGLRAGVVPRWLAWLGFPVALSLLVAFLLIPFIVLLAWLLIVSIVLVWRREAPEAKTVSSSA
jgi:hypothetical protein